MSTTVAPLTACRLADLKAVVKFLRLVPRTLEQSGRAPDDIDVVHINAGHESGADPGYYLSLEKLRDAAATERLQTVARRLMTVDFVEQLPEDSFRQKLPDFLEQNFQLVPHDGAAGRHDLMVAVYDLSLLENVFESAPKNPRQALEINFLAQHEDVVVGWPRCIFTLPQAQASIKWDLWIEAVNRRSPGQQRDAVKLFYRVPSRTASAHYYIEYGYAHPVDELPELHRCRTNGWLLLAKSPESDNDDVVIGISGNGKSGNSDANGHGGSRDVHWLEISRGDCEAPVRHVESALQPFHYEVPHNLRVPLTTTDPPRKFKLAAQLRRAVPDQPMRLQSLTDQIQAMKSQLFRMERERDILLQRAEARMRYVLCFEQTAEEGTGGHLCPDFERFLSMSEHLLDQFYYTLQVDSQTGRRTHVLLTVNAMHSDDLHLGLADAWFYQPEQWTKWSFNVFVESRFELSPRIDDRSLKDGFWQAFREALQNSLPDVEAPSRGVEQCLALVPNERLARADSDLVPFRVLVFEIPRDRGTLLASLELLNTAFPAHELRSRELALNDLRTSLEEAAGDLDEYVDEIEERLVAESDRRLDDLREQWDELAPQIEQALQLVGNQTDHFVEVDRMIDSFTTSWTDFSHRFRDVTESLVADKLRVMQQLEAEHSGWKETVEQVNESHRDVQADCDEIEVDMQQRVEETELERLATEEQLEEAQKQYADTSQHLRELNAEISQSITAGEQYAAEVSQLEAEASRKVAHLQSVDQRVVATCDTLKRHWGRFGNLVGELRQHVTDTSDTVSQIESQTDELQSLSDDWDQTLKDGQHQHSVVRQSSAQTGQKNQATDQRLKTVLSDTESELARTEAELQKVQNRIHNVESKIQRLQATRDDVRDRTERLKELEAEAIEVSKLLDDEQATREELEGQLEQRRELFWFHREKIAGELSVALRELMRDLKTLGGAESSFRDAVELHRSVRLKARMLREIQKARGLTEDEHRDIWS